MKKDAQKTDWESIEDDLIREWYYIIKITKKIIPKTYPYFTYQGILHSIIEDPEYKKKED